MILNTVDWVGKHQTNFSQIIS